MYQIYPRLPAQPDRKRILVRLGHKNATHTLPPDWDKQVDDAIAQCSPAGAYAVVDTSVVSEDTVLLADTPIHSAFVARLFTGCTNAMVMVGTAGDLAAQIQGLFDQGDAAKAVVLDAVAAQTADACLDVLMRMAGTHFLRTGLRLANMRVSPGYGDIDLSVQRLLAQLVHADELGIQILDSGMLSPDKSVLAMVGLHTV